MALGDPTGAMEAYQNSRTITEQLAGYDASNSDWQSDLATSYEKSGDVQLKQNDLAAALKSYRGCLAIRERLAQSDAGNADWQRDLASGYAKLAKVQRQSNDPHSASDALRRDIVAPGPSRPIRAR
jgi:hypothetical protein